MEIFIDEPCKGNQNCISIKDLWSIIYVDVNIDVCVIYLYIYSIDVKSSKGK